MDIFNDPAFVDANKVLDGVLKERKRAGKDHTVDHKEALRDCHLAKLEMNFSDTEPTDNPRKLSMLVWYVLTTHFCPYGEEIQSKLTKSDLVFFKP